MGEMSEIVERCAAAVRAAWWGAHFRLRPWPALKVSDRKNYTAVACAVIRTLAASPELSDPCRAELAALIWEEGQ